MSISLSLSISLSSRMHPDYSASGCRMTDMQLADETDGGGRPGRVAVPWAIVSVLFDTISNVARLGTLTGAFDHHKQ